MPIQRKPRPTPPAPVDPAFAPRPKHVTARYLEFTHTEQRTYTLKLEPGDSFERKDDEVIVNRRGMKMIVRFQLRNLLWWSEYERTEEVPAEPFNPADAPDGE